MSVSKSLAPRSQSFLPSQGRVVATVEARMGSSRLPGKVLAPIGDLPSLAMMIGRLRRSQTLSGICVATTTNPDDDAIVGLARELGVDVFRGSEDNVLERVLLAAQSVGADVIVETTGDCPLIDPGLVDACVLTYFSVDVHYCANVGSGLPRGLEAQVFATELLAEVNSLTSDPADQEHVSLYIYEHPELYDLLRVPPPAALHRPSWRWTVDTPEDLAFVRAVVENLGPFFTAADAARWLDHHPEVVELNSAVVQKPIR